MSGSNQQLNCLTLRRAQHNLSAFGSDLPKTTLPCQAYHAGPSVGWSKPRTHGSQDGIADATRAPCGPNGDFVAPRTSIQMLALSLPGRDVKATQVSASNWRNPFAATISKSTATAAPAPVVKYIQPAPTFQTAPAPITRHEQGRHSRLLQQPQVDHGAPVLYGGPTNFDSTMTVTGVDMNEMAFKTCCKASGWLQRSFAVWSACGSSSFFPGSKLVPPICLVVVSVLSWMIFHYGFFMDLIIVMNVLSSAGDGDKVQVCGNRAQSRRKPGAKMTVYRI